MNVPRHIDELTAEWLSTVLGRPVEVMRVDRLAEDSAFAAQLFRLHLTGDSTTEDFSSTVIVKLPVGADNPARQILDGFHAYDREVAFYRDVVGRGATVRTPRARFVAHDPDSHDFVLIIEDLAPLEAADQLSGLSMAQAETIIDALAEFHCWAWENDNLDVAGAGLPRIDALDTRAHHAMFGEVFDLAWPQVAARLYDEIAPEVHELCNHFSTLIHYLAEALGTPRTIIHGELRSDNLFLPLDGSDPYLIDFQAATRACGLLDVAYLITSSVRSDVRCGNDAVLVQRYVDGIARRGITSYGFDQAWRQYRISAMFGLVYPVLASTRWEASGPRGRLLLDEMVRRSTTAISQIGAVELLP